LLSANLLANIVSWTLRFYAIAIAELGQQVRQKAEGRGQKAEVMNVEVWILN
jgi:hypothetical protein